MSRPPIARGPTHEAATRVADGIFDRIEDALAAQPRSQQKLIGPSEIGVPCTRALVAKIAQLGEPDRGPAWKAWVGTQIHAGLEDIFTTDGAQAAGYVAETKVTVGRIGPHEIKGTCDLWSGDTVVDWKTTSPSRLAKYKSAGPGEQYRVQAHLYGRGFELRGERPSLVMIVFLPRDGNIEDGYVWHEAYQPDIAAAALRRANHVYDLIHNVGAEQAMDLFDPCELPYCHWCAASRAISSTGAMFQTTTK